MNQVMKVGFNGAYMFSSLPTSRTFVLKTERFIVHTLNISLIDMSSAKEKIVYLEQFCQRKKCSAFMDLSLL